MTQTYRSGRSVLAQWGLVACLTLISMLAQIDKNILVLMVGPIKHDFGVTDVQISFLIGAAFAVANIVMGLPAGWLADRCNRRVVISGAVLLWSLAVISNAAASIFLVLIIARVVVGGAEALISPASYSLIRDGVDEGRRARALSVYTMALMLGTGLSLVLGGPLIGAIEAAGVHSVPLIGAVSPWQATLFVIGLVGIPLAFIVFLPKDPGRPRETGDDKKHSLADIVRYLSNNRVIFLPLLVFTVALSMVTSGLGSWMPAMAARTFHMSMREFGLVQGGLMLVMGPLGLWFAGQAMDKKGKSRLSDVAFVGVVVSVAVTVLTVSLCLARTVTTFWIVDGMVVLFSWTFMAVTSTVVARYVSSSRVGLIMALILVLNGLIGQGLSPTLIALAGKYLYADLANALPAGMATVFAGSGIVAIVAALMLHRRFLKQQTSAGGLPAPVFSGEH